MKNRGKPANANIRVYGIRKAPEGREGKKNPSQTHTRTENTMNLSVFPTVLSRFILPFFPRLKYPTLVFFALCRTARFICKSCFL